MSPDPEVNAIHGFADTSIVAAPFYGKLNFAKQIYCLHGPLRLGRLFARRHRPRRPERGNFGAGERFYVGQAVSFRLDFKGPDLHGS